MRYHPRKPGPEFDAACDRLDNADLLLYPLCLWLQVNLVDAMPRGHGIPELAQLEYLISLAHRDYEARGFDSQADVLAGLDARWPHGLESVMRKIGLGGLIFAKPGQTAEDAALDEVMRLGGENHWAACTVEEIISKLRKDK